MPLRQAAYDLRCEWGSEGLLHLAPGSDAVIVIDVLSFTTAVDIAIANGASILPYRWKDDSAGEYARVKDALLACGRAAGAYSLSPASLRAIPRGAALVLPSPNGSALAFGAPDVPLYAACLRNAPAVAAHVSQRAARIAVIPAGEHWPSGALRPCLEDWLGAGAVLASLAGGRSPEAELAVATFERFRGDLKGALSRCGSGQELIERGFGCDVELAAEYGISSAVPVLAGDRFTNGRVSDGGGGT